MFRTTVKSHIMIAHSLNNPCFGKAAGLHGATYVIESEFSSSKLKNNMVINMDHAMETLNSVCSKLNYKNLDELDDFQGKITTTEYLAQWIHKEIAQQVQPIFWGSLKITLHESHIAYASYEGSIEMYKN